MLTITAMTIRILIINTTIITRIILPPHEGPPNACRGGRQIRLTYLCPSFASGDWGVREF